MGTSNIIGLGSIDCLTSTPRIQNKDRRIVGKQIIGSQKMMAQPIIQKFEQLAGILNGAFLIGFIVIPASTLPMECSWV